MATLWASVLRMQALLKKGEQHPGGRQERESMAQ